MQGRVSSTFIAMFSLAQVLGMLLSGLLADWLGLRQLFLACAVLVIALACAGWLVLRPRASVDPSA
jgi:predicted MFS family arabinose efflux permease